MEQAGQHIAIPLSKSKLILMLLGALVFVALGLWFVIAPPVVHNSFWGTTRIIVVGYASIIFFGICAIFIARKFIDKRPGLIMDENGLIDNSSGLSVGQVYWSEIENISVIKIHRQKLIMIKVNDPEKFVEKQKNKLKKRMMLMNLKMYGSPLSITSNGLKISFDELFSILTNKWNASKQSSTNGQNKKQYGSRR